MDTAKKMEKPSTNKRKIPQNRGSLLIWTAFIVLGVGSEDGVSVSESLTAFF